jgi:hypothetical protein
MSEFATLHPFEPSFVERYVMALQGELPPADLLPMAPAWADVEIARVRRGYERARAGNDQGANAVSHALARLLAVAQPVFFVPGAGFTQLESRIDRGIGMLLRPPSRLFADAGLEIAVARAMPIRLDASGGGMGGAFMPPMLVPQFRNHLETRMDRLARRMAEAELDAPAFVGLLLEAATFATEGGLGLYEASDVIVPGVPESQPPGLRLLQPDRKRLDRHLRLRLEEASRPPRDPGLLSRLFGRGHPTNRSEIWEDSHPWRGGHDVTPPPERE